MREFIQLTKPRITWLILMSTRIGYFFGLRGGVHPAALLHTIGASASPCSGKAIGARHANIGLDKLSALKQQWLVHGFRQCVSETIAEIQPGPMPAPPKVVVGLARQSALLHGHGLNHDGSGSQKRLCLPGSVRPCLPFEDNGQFQMVRDTEAADVRRQDQSCKILGLRLLK
jgi:hypothetical protein